MNNATQTMSRYAYNNKLQRWQQVSNGRIVSGRQLADEMQRHMSATYDALEGLTRQVYAGQLNVAQWQIAVAQELKDAHLAQAMFAVGGKRNMTAVDYGRVGGVLADEYRYLSNFADDIASGTRSLAQSLPRIRQYGNSSQQAYWRAMTTRTTDEEWIHWELNPAEHCQDCLDLAGSSPYKPGNLPTWPGAGETRCRGNCNCTLRRGPR